MWQRYSAIFGKGKDAAATEVVAGAAPKEALGSPKVRQRGSAKRGRHSTIFVSPNASVQWQHDGLAIPTTTWFLGAGFLGAPPISLTMMTLGRL